MTTLIIEDEKIAAERLQLLLQRCAPQVQVLSVLDTVEASVAWFFTHPTPDFILLDIHLADGSAFEIFRQVNILVPVIFTTAFDQYSMEAFKLLSIDYLLKPVTADALSFAIHKLQTLRQPQAPPIFYTQLLQLLQQAQQKYKTRFVGKIGPKTFFIDINEIAYFLSDNKIVRLYTCEGNHYVLEYTLEALEKMLDPVQFFRVNRSVIVKAKAIEQVKPYINSRLKIIVRAGSKQSEAIVSRDRVNEFKNWANN
ncbi:MAG: LytTR family DNA-binding domain-containing protein [Chitinophagaceae bacterium]